MKFLISASRILSAIFSPLLMGTYSVLIAMWLSYLCFSPAKAKLIVISVTFVATCIIPLIAIFLLFKAGIVTDSGLNKRKERTLPYLLCIMCYIGTGIYYHFVNAPVWLSMAMFGGALALIIQTCVNSVWKISGHAAGVGGLVGLAYFIMITGNAPENMEWQFLLLVLIAGLVGTSRLILERHTLMQVAAGFLNGFACVFVPALVSTYFTAG